MPFDVAQYVAQILRIRAVGPLLEFQPQWLAGFLHEIHELVHFQQRDEGVQQAARYRCINSTSAARPGVISGTSRL